LTDRQTDRQTDRIVTDRIVRQNCHRQTASAFHGTEKNTGQILFN